MIRNILGFLLAFRTMNGSGDHTDIPGADVFEKERIELESERLKLAQERLAAREAEIAAREAEMASSRGRDFAVPPILLLVAAVLLLGTGLFLGTAIGFDLGREHSVKPRRVLLSRAFINAISAPDRPVAADSAGKPDADETPDWKPRRRKSAPPPVTLVR